MPIGWGIATVVLWIAVICLAVVVLGLLRQTAQGRARDVPSRPGHLVPAIGTRIPDFTATAADGSAFTPNDLIGSPTVLMFTSSRCEACHQATAQLRESDPGMLPSSVIVVTDADSADVAALPDAIRVVVEEHREISDTLGVDVLPYAIAVDGSGIVRAKQPATQLAHIAALALAAASVPAPATQQPMHRAM